MDNNIFGEPLIPCNLDPITGFLRDGCCNDHEYDHGQHWICVIMTPEFLDFSYSEGNDLTTPRPEWNFPGLKPGDQWCLCATRWQDALEVGCAPLVKLEATNEKVLEIVAMEDLLKFAYRQLNS